MEQSAVIAVSVSCTAVVVTILIVVSVLIWRRYQKQREPVEMQACPPTNSLSAHPLSPLTDGFTSDEKLNPQQNQSIHSSLPRSHPNSNPQTSIRVPDQAPEPSIAPSKLVPDVLPLPVDDGSDQRGATRHSNMTTVAPLKSQISDFEHTFLDDSQSTRGRSTIGVRGGGTETGNTSMGSFTKYKAQEGGTPSQRHSAGRRRVHATGAQSTSRMPDTTYYSDSSDDEGVISAFLPRLGNRLSNRFSLGSALSHPRSSNSISGLATPTSSARPPQLRLRSFDVDTLSGGGGGGGGGGGSGGGGSVYGVTTTISSPTHTRRSSSLSISFRRQSTSPLQQSATIVENPHTEIWSFQNFSNVRPPATTDQAAGRSAAPPGQNSLPRKTTDRLPYPTKGIRPLYGEGQPNDPPETAEAWNAAGREPSQVIVR